MQETNDQKRAFSNEIGFLVHQSRKWMVAAEEALEEHSLQQLQDRLINAKEVIENAQHKVYAAITYQRESYKKEETK